MSSAADRRRERRRERLGFTDEGDGGARVRRRERGARRPARSRREAVEDTREDTRDTLDKPGPKRLGVIAAGILALAMGTVGMVRENLRPLFGGYTRVTVAEVEARLIEEAKEAAKKAGKDQKAIDKIGEKMKGLLVIDESERAKRREQAEKSNNTCVFDPVTDETLCRDEPGKAESWMAMLEANGGSGLTALEYNGGVWTSREACARLFEEATGNYERATGKTADLQAMLRFPHLKEKAYKRSFGTGPAGVLKRIFGIQDYAMAVPRKSPHGFCAVDIGRNDSHDPKLGDWHELQPYMEAVGFVCGFNNGIGNDYNEKPDPNHCDYGRLTGPVGSEAIQKSRQKYCKRFGWHCKIIEEREKKAVEEAAKKGGQAKADKAKQKRQMARRSRQKNRDRHA